MKSRLIATYKENKDGLFQSLRGTFDKFLARDPVDWKRSFGRPTRNVFVQLTFDSFNPNSIALEESWFLCNRPFLHSFWIECDLESYKSSVKDSVSEWLSQLRDKDIHDWLIVVVVNMDNRVKNKILRNSVYDKVKNDFCSKQVERCILLSEPYKLDSKSLESYNQVAGRMRVLVIDSITRVLDCFEENMRSQRERRIEHEWNFCSYFLLQEELAFMYEMMGLYEDAMIQYDELDALFTQFILNSAIAKPAPWLDLMCRNIPARWGGSCLCQPIDNLIRNLISLNKCSILDLRSYLFGRQGHLLVQLGRISELIKRSVPFIHNCIREVNILKIPVPSGAIDCWTFLSCMEVLSFCPLDNKLDSEESKMIASGAAELWNLATQKANCIGRLCGLVSTSSGQTSDEQMIVESLLPGLVHIAGESEHLNRLLEVLTGKEPYIQFYLELSEQCICFLKHVSRVRSAKFTGKELADLYIMTGDYKKAENYLVDLLKMYKTEGWEMLANDVRQKLAECQKFLKQTFKYCRTSLNIASSSTVQLEMRKKCLQDALEASKSQVDNSMERMKMRCPPAFLLSLVMPCDEVALHQCMQMQLEIFSNLPSPVTLDEVVLSFRGRGNILEQEREIEMKKKHKRNISTDSAAFTTQPQKLMQRCHSRQDSGHFETRRNSQSSILGGFELFNKISETISFNFQSIDIQSSVQYVEDGDQQLAVSSSLLCRSPLKRSLSSPKSQRLLNLAVIHDDDVVLRSSCVPLLVGRNSIQLIGCFSKIGSYHVSVAVMKLNEIDFVQTFHSDGLNVDVTLREMKLSLNKANFVAGFKQDVEITLMDEATESAFPNSLEIHASQGLLLQLEDLSTDDDNKMILSEAILDNFKKVRNLHFRALVTLDDWTRDEKLIKQITLKSSDHVDKVCTLSFNNPFTVCHKFFTSLSKKFVQVVVSSLLADATEINSWILTDSTGTTDFKNLNIGNSMTLYPVSASTFVWQIEGNIQHPLDLKFDMKYCEVNQPDVTYHLGYHFQLDDIEMRIVICSHLSRKELLSNEWIPMKFIITRVKDFPNQLFYSITHDVGSWKLSGSTSGEVRFTGCRAKVVINILPLKCKQLKLPKITIFQGTSQDKENTSEHSPNDKFNPNWIFDASEISTVLVKPQDLSPPIHHFQAVVEAHS